ncbi:MAG TPA: zinc ribbon domain-containing protein [Casimicrobiaceae bacterium]|nr:zinc ribbon domain-containing protein [Casimicrobiaceae bacterium]
MPIYEYRCASCGHELEALQKLSDALLVECPACHKPDLQKLVSAAGFQLKGSGWYVTDFRNGGGKPAPTGVAAGKAGGAKGAEAGASGAAPAADRKSGDGTTGAGSASTASTPPATSAGTTSGGSGS